MKFAIIGCGQIAQRHAEQIDRMGVLSAVCDIKKERAEKLGKKYEAFWYLDIDDLLENEIKMLDVVSICTPNYLHAKHTIKALEAGFHVICEKPMALNVKDCQTMLDRAQKAERYLFVVKQNRFNPIVERVKEIIDEGRLGQIFNVQLNCFWNRNYKYYIESDWKGDKEKDGGTLFTQFSHFIDLLVWMIGDVKEVYTFKDNFMHKQVVKFEDTGVIILRFLDGTLGTINFTVNAHSRNMEGSLTIFGIKGTVKIGGQYLNELEYQDIEDYEIKDLPKGNPANDYGHYKGSMSNHDKVYEYATKIISSGRLMGNGLGGLRTVELIEKIYEASK